MADLDALSQVFGNLVENAMKYGRAGGRVRLGARKQGALVEFYVQDFGPGIAYEHLPRIFERFYRVDKARSRESGGPGWGWRLPTHRPMPTAETSAVRASLGSAPPSSFACRPLPPVPQRFRVPRPIPSPIRG